MIHDRYVSPYDWSVFHGSYVCTVPCPCHLYDNIQACLCLLISADSGCLKLDIEIANRHSIIARHIHINGLRNGQPLSRTGSDRLRDSRYSHVRYTGRSTLQQEPRNKGISWWFGVVSSTVPCIGAEKCRTFVGGKKVATLDWIPYRSEQNAVNRIGFRCCE